jgi:hypothetical protein
MFSRRLTRPIAAGAAVIAIAIGAYAVGHSSSTHAATSAAAGGPAAQFGPRVGHSLPGQQLGRAPEQQIGQVPAGWHPGSGTIITGAVADRAKAAAVAEYPGGTVNRVLQLSDGSYAVHRIGTPAPHHVFVSKDFKVTGAA